MKELVEVIAKSLVENPDEVVVTETEKDDAVVVELKVGPSDMGKVIGRQGQNCQGYPYRSKSGFFQKQQKSDCRYSAMISKKYGCRSCGDMAPVFTMKVLSGVWGMSNADMDACKDYADRGVLNGRFIESWCDHHYPWCKRRSKGISRLR